MIKSQPFICLFTVLLFASCSIIHGADLSDLKLAFEHISTQQGLAQSTVNCFLKDSKGFLWIGTCGGLDRYDGYELKNYRPDPDRPNSLSHTYVQALYEEVTDTSRVLWIATEGGGLNKLDLFRDKITTFIHDPDDPGSLSDDLITSMVVPDGRYIFLGTMGGLNKFDRKTRQFKTYRHNPQDSASLSYDNINYLRQDRYGLIWIGMFSGAIDLFDPESENFRHIKFNESPGIEKSASNVWCIFEDSRANIWIGTQHGLYRIPQTEISQKVYQNLSSVEIIFNPEFNTGIDDWVISIHEDSAGILWLGSFGSGLILYDPETKEHIHHTHDSQDPASLGSNDLKYVYGDSANHIIWIGTESSGVNKLPRQKKMFTNYSHDPEDAYSVDQNSFSDLCEDISGDIWIGLGAEGMDRFIPRTKQFKHYHHEPGNDHSLPPGKVQSVFLDDNHTLWIGTTSGLASYNRHRDHFDYHSLSLPGLKKGFNLWIQDICQRPVDPQGTLWLATALGLVSFHPDSGYTRIYSNDQNDQNSISSDFTTCIFADSNAVWIGTMVGLNKFNQGTGQFTRFLHNPEDTGTISNNFIYFVYKDKSGRLWIGTDGGLNLFDEQKKTFSHFSMADGLPSNTIVTILEDKDGHLWLGTLNGICHFNPDDRACTNYDERDGLLGNEIWWWSALSDRNGNLYFGTNRGLNVFHPDSIRHNTHVPPVVISDFEIFNRPVSPYDSEFLTRSVTESDEIILPWDQDIFTIKFASLDFNIPDKNLYAHMLEGVDRDWVYTGASRRMATYTKLSPGSYLFHVKGSNNDGMWNATGRTLLVTILPPWWRSQWAYLLYIIAGLGLLVFVWLSQVRRLKLVHKLEMEHMTAENLKQVDQMKSRFFTNISHEFRTPLTLIQGPVQQFLNGTFQGNFREQYQLILRNTNRLLDLVNQLLDLSRLEAGKLVLRVSSMNIVPYLKGLVQAFASLAEERNISLTFRADLTDLRVSLDKQRFEQIVNNLIFNALKFTPDDGSISVNLLIPGTPNNDKFINIFFRNSGPGIQPDQINKVFDRFYQAGNESIKSSEGAGIGLALVKELVELHKGTISVKSVPDKETEFLIQLPLGKEKLSPEQFPQVIQPSEPAMSAQDSAQTVKPVRIKDKSVRILIVEDHRDLRKYITDIFEDKYQLYTAGDGSEGLEMARTKLPDLIISDIMMPVMDGLELCQKLKLDEMTSHIPLILITARSGQEDIMKGLGTGADDYITKPFDAEELKLRVQNLFARQERMHKRFRSEPGIHPREISVSSVDEQFLGRLWEVIEDNIANPAFNMPMLEQCMHLSRSALYRKIVALTGLNPTQLIRHIRMQHARKLIELRTGNITEIALAVGFSNPGYFSSCFYDQYGIKPSEFIRTHS